MNPAALASWMVQSELFDLWEKEKINVYLKDAIVVRWNDVSQKLDTLHKASHSQGTLRDKKEAEVIWRILAICISCFLGFQINEGLLASASGLLSSRAGTGLCLSGPFQPCHPIILNVSKNDLMMAPVILSWQIDRDWRPRKDAGVDREWRMARAAGDLWECFIHALFIHLFITHIITEWISPAPGARVDTGKEEQRVTEDKESYEKEPNKVCDLRGFTSSGSHRHTTNHSPSIPQPPTPGVSRRSQTFLSTGNCFPRKHLFAKPPHIFAGVHIRTFYFLSPPFWGCWLLFSSEGPLTASCYLLPSEKAGRAVGPAFHRCGHIRK